MKIPNLKNNTGQKEGRFYQIDAKGRLRTHIPFCGIDFSIDPSIPLSSALQMILKASAEGNIRHAVAVSYGEGGCEYSPATYEEVENTAPEHRMRAVVNGVGTELLAASYDGSPFPELTPEHVEQAKNLWLQPAFVNWADPNLYLAATPSHIMIEFPSMHVISITSLKIRTSARAESG